MKYFAPRRALPTLFALFLGLSLVSATPARAQQKPREAGEKSLTHTNEARVSVLPDKSNRYALIIGVDKYISDNNISTLEGAGNDARALADALKRYADFPEENVMVLTSVSSQQPTRIAILRALNNIRRAAQGKNSMIVVAFSGHGVERDGVAYLMPADATADKDLFAASAIEVAQMTAEIKKTGAKQVLFILDACRNDPLAGGKGDVENPLQKSFVEAVDFGKQNEGVEAFVTLYAAKVGQRAWEDPNKKQGYFTRAIVEGLRGEAADKETGLVTLQRLVNYVEERVPDLVQKEKGKVQTPYYNISGYRADQLVLAKTAAVAPKPVAPVVVKPTTGGLSVVSTKGARLTVTSAAGDFNKTLPLESDRLSLDNLKPGEYKIVAQLDGHKTLTETHKVVAGDRLPVVMTLSALTHSVTVTTNVEAGKVEYGVKGEKELRLVEIKGRQAVISGLRHGAEYTFKVTPAGGAFASSTTSHVVNSDAPLEIKLKSLPSAQQVDSDFSTEQWLAPASWKFSSQPQGVLINGAGLALLREERTGRFTDFGIVSNVKLIGPTAVSFVLRAVDERNYYLLRLTGDKGDPAKKLQFYVVKDGREHRISNTVQLAHFNLNEDFELQIKATGNRFQVTIIDTAGRPEQVGDIIDESNTFTAGTVGLSAKEGDRASVNRFLVCPGVCQ